ncbi:MAG: cytochrome c [Proteobacteria bacterium]|nr:cytochrome c [Pseudomonadota bacterium]
MRLLALIGALAIVLGLATAAFFFGGYYNVAATEEDPGPVAWALVKVRSASIARRDKITPPGNLADPATIKEGARRFAQFGCANCHGGPGVDWAKFSEGLNPGPPDLKEATKNDPPAHIFWIVKNGIRMTGMPSFSKAGASDEQIWQIAAFVKQLPSVSDADFKSWTATPAQ